MDEVGLTCRAYAENIAYTTRSSDDAADTVVANWMNSPGHRANILDEKNYGTTQTGIGVAHDEETGRYYFTQVFRRP